MRGRCHAKRDGGGVGRQRRKIDFVLEQHELHEPVRDVREVRGPKETAHCVTAVRAFFACAPSRLNRAQTALTANATDNHP